MDGYWIWLAFLALTVISLSFIQLQAGRNKRLLREHRQMQMNVQRLQDQIRERETRLDHLQRGRGQLLKLKSRSSDLENELKKTKRTIEYESSERLQYLESYVAGQSCNPSAVFLSTFSPLRQYSIENRLCRMLETARFEVVVVSPWIKRQTWNKIAAPLKKFSRRGGRVVVFMRGRDSDYSLGMSDDIQDEVKRLGGELLFVRPLHAKIYMIDRKEAIVTSANLSKGGIDDNYEAGVWLNDPHVLSDICAYVDGLYKCRQN